MCVATLETELADAKALRSRLVEADTGSESETNKARAGLQNAQTCLIKVEQETKLAQKYLSKVWEWSLGSAKEAENVTSKLAKISTRAQALEAEVKILKLQIDGVPETSYVTNIFENKKPPGSKDGRNVHGFIDG